jgi:23S rRNA pseudouridine2605 synthase
MVRLSKLLTNNSVCSRREAERILGLGLVRINGKRVYQNTLVPIDSQVRLFSESGIREERPVTKLWMINKPRGYVCTERDPEGRKTVYSLLP